MNTSLLIAILLALFMAGLYIEAQIFRAIHDDEPTLYKLFAVRDQLVRLVVENRIARDDPYFDALYVNVNLFLKASKAISGPTGWPLAAASGQYLARNPEMQGNLVTMPSGGIPEPLEHIAEELRSALGHLVTHHFGIHVQIDSHRRELARIRKQQAQAMLDMLPRGAHCRA